MYFSWGSSSGLHCGDSKRNVLPLFTILYVEIRCIFFLILPDVLKTWWPAPTWRQSLHRVFYHLQTRQRCLKTDWNSESLSYVPSSKIHTYLVTKIFSFDKIISVICVNLQALLYIFLGVIPKAVMDSMEFLMNFHLPKETRKGHKRRHSFKGKTKYEPTENVLQNIQMHAFWAHS